MSDTKETVLEINLAHLTHNFKYLKSKVALGVKMLTVVKAFGYGSDVTAIAKHLQEIGNDYFAVAYVSEGIMLREAGITKPILVLHPQPVNFTKLIEHQLEPSLYSPRILREFVSVASKLSKTEYPVHIKFNTGLNRLGFWENDVEHIIERLKETNSIKIVSMFSHLAASEDHSEREFTLGQINSFKKTASEMIDKLGYTPILHQSNTSGILNYPEAHFNMVRAGIGLYGYGNEAQYDAQLKPVASLKSIISQIHMLEPGETLGYNRAYTAPGYAKTATIPIGHADGIGRQYGNKKGFVMIQNKRAYIIGNVCMDMIMVDITDIDCKEGDEVIIFDAQSNAATVAESAGTISYELLTAISPRVKRIIVDNN
ncbi:alanine racemase [Aquimarina sp. 2201CG5-10]|uniref:alanine racemase n=1 Tax=Aquimarina callyspongiae TaxID=3098150 RepID=UPI002AB4B712|nr:alanine racemase [Aquimarina sp. 2201CG5-10]MDY8135165.1 alanine racemase [Aquimarina sp. 2201CG5-10]